MKICANLEPFTIQNILSVSLVPHLILLQDYDCNLEFICIPRDLVHRVKVKKKKFKKKTSEIIQRRNRCITIIYKTLDVESLPSCYERESRLLFSILSFPIARLL